MQISSVTAAFAPSTQSDLYSARQDQQALTRQIMPGQSQSYRSGMVFSLPRHSLTSAAAALSSSYKSDLTSAQGVAAYQSTMNAQGLFGYQSTLGFRPLMA